MRGIVFDIDDTLYCRQDMLVKAAETVLGVKVDDWHEFITIFYEKSDINMAALESGEISTHDIQSEGHKSPRDRAAHGSDLHPAAEIGRRFHRGRFIISRVPGKHRYHRLAAVVNRPALRGELLPAIHRQLRIFAHAPVLSPFRNR